MMLVVDTDKTSKPPQKVKMRTKVIVLFFITLIMSGGLLYYFDTSSIKPENPYFPFIFYGFLGLSIALVILLIYISLIFFRGQSKELFPAEINKNAKLSTDPGSRPNPSLENLFRAEKRYFQMKTAENTKPSSTSRRQIKKETTKRIRIGSIPLEESISTERIRLKSKSSKNRKAKRTNKVTTFLCPDCGGKELYYEAGLISGYKYHCKDCDYIGTLVIEKDFNIEE